MALFEPAYRIVRKHEGYYLNDPADTGGETYAGIARNLWPNWPGWSIVDDFKETRQSDNPRSFSSFLKAFGIGDESLMNPIGTNEKIPGDEIEILLEDFYHQRWIDSKAGQIDNQTLANAYFDFFILASRAAERIQLALRRLGFNVTVDNKMGSATIKAINDANPTRLLDLFVDERIDFHEEMISSGIVSSKFKNGWINRANQFDPGQQQINIWWWVAGSASAAVIGYGIYKRVTSS